VGDSIPTRRLVVLLLVLLGGSFPLQAQDVTTVIGKPRPGARGFGGAGAAPVSPTTVLQFVMEPRDSGGSQLAYAIAIRGAPDWYRQRTVWGPGDSIPGFVTHDWQVGGLRYTIAYNAAQLLLRAFGTEVDLRKGNLVFVVLGPEGTDGKVESTRLVRFTMFEPGGFGPRFVQAVAELRRFAGLEGQP
jgi:hypothetical protein